MNSLPLLTALLLGALALPLLAAITCFFFRNHERKTSLLSSMASIGFALFIGATIAVWLTQGMAVREWNLGPLYRNGEYSFDIVLLLDLPGVVLLSLVGILTPIIVKYCRYYLHREAGYGRFFVTIWFFLFGVELLATAGTMDLLFAAWEIVGIASFLLIGFYRERATPVRNALRAYSVYRFCDVGLLLGTWFGHLLWHESRHFSALAALPSEQVAASHPVLLVGMGFMILLAATGKSAQFPFCFWLARAMEGPTPSSAIFYGALSIHAGVFLLIRTLPLWSLVPEVRLAVALTGLLSMIIATLAGRVQSNIKAQIAYASIAQVGAMFIELALGLKSLALLHLFSHALLRCYQLLVSPSVVAHLLQLQRGGERSSRLSDWSFERWLPGPMRSTLYAFALNEGYLEWSIQQLVLRPLFRLASPLRLLDTRWGSLAAVAAIVSLVLARRALPSESSPLSHALLAAVTLLMAGAALSALSEKESSKKGWKAAGVCSLLAGLAIYLVRPESVSDVLFYLSGVIPAWALGFSALNLLERKGTLNLKEYQGKVHDQPGICLLLFLSFIAMTGLPISPTFIGIDLLLYHASSEYFWFSNLVTLIFVVNGIATARLFSLIALGTQGAVSRTT